MVNKVSFEIRTELRSYQFVLNADSPIEELLQVLGSVHEYYTKVKEEADAKAKAEQKPPEG